MTWKWIRRTIKWIWGVMKDKPLDPSCPTCGPDLGFSPCAPGDESPPCSEMEAAADILRARYKFIYTQNLYKRRPKAPPQDCAPRGGTPILVKSASRCQFAGEVRSYKGRAMVCLQCSTCGGSSGGEPAAKVSESGAKIPIPSSSCVSGNCGGGGSDVGADGSISYASIPNGKCVIDGTCPEVSCGYWYAINYGRKTTPLANTTITGREKRNRPADSGGGGEIDPLLRAGDPVASGCQPEFIYDATGCKVIGIKPVLLARGRLAYWESTETYPLTLKCDGETKIHGADAGKPIRHHKMPNRALEPHFLSRQTGVVSHLDPGNKEWNNTYVRFIQLEIRNLSLPPNPPKPLNEVHPLTFLMIPRTGAQKSVRSSGLFINTFLGNIHGEEFAIPKNGVNGPEYFDKNIYYGGNDTHRGGQNMPRFAMVFHGPDTEFDRPTLDSDTVKFELNLFGKGWQYGSCAEGEVPDSRFLGRVNQKGVRAAVNLNHFVKAAPSSSGAANLCIKGISYADENSVTDKGDHFTYPLLNIYRESAVYVEAKGTPYPLRHTKNKTMVNNGHPGGNLANDGTSDFSFLGDTLWHEKAIHDASAYYGNLKTLIPDQYGGLINASYHDVQPIRMEDVLKGTTTIDRGDSFIHQHYLIRKSFVSDKLMEDISPRIEGGGLSERNDVWGLMLKNLFDNIGLEECATCPEHGDPSDPRNGGQLNGGTHDALRESLPAGPWNGVGEPPPATGRDIFYPNLQKMQVIFPVESDVNLYYRQTGAVEAGEFYYRKLKGQNLDSNFPHNSDWTKGLLNRFYVESKENPKWKMIFRVFANLIFTYGIGIYLIVRGLIVAIEAFSNLVIGLTTNIGAIAAALLGMVISALGVAWIKFWAKKDHDNKFWDNLLGIDGCWPDIVARPEVSGSRWRIKDGRVKQFEDNYWKYNYDYSKQNEIQVTLGLPDPYSTCICPLETTYEILYSNMQNTNSMTDAYRNFKVNSYMDLQSHSGKIKKMFKLANRVYVQTSDGMFSLQSGSSQLELTDDKTVYIGNANFFMKPVEVFGGLREGRGGTNDPNACEVTKWGYINVDVEARQIGLFTGDSYQLLGDSGMTKFLDRYMPYEAPAGTLRDEKHPDGIGFSLGVDNGRGLLFITKKDFRMDAVKGKVDRSWTLTYDMDNLAWLGFEFFQPTLYTWDRFQVYSMNKGTMWQHNAEGIYSSVYGKSVPMVIDFVINDKELMDSFKFINSTIHVDIDQWVDFGLVPRNDIFFDKIGVYNTFQSSGLLPVVHKRQQEQPEATQQNPNLLPVADIHRGWRFNKLIDKVHTTGIKLFTTWHDDFFTDFNPAPIGGPQTSESIIDNYLVMRLVMDSSDTTTRVLLKHVVTDVNTEIL